MCGFSLSLALAEEMTLCDKESDLLNDELALTTTISDGLSKNLTHLSLSFVASVVIRDNDLEKAKAVALQSAFRSMAQLITRQMISPQQLLALSDVLNQKIYQRARFFVQTFQTEQSGVCGENYRVLVTALFKVSDLRQALLKHKILDIEYAAKEIHLLNIREAKDYEFIKDFLRERTRNLKRLVEKYQKKGEIYFVVETSSSADEIIDRLKEKSQEYVPNFQVQKGEKGEIEIRFLP